RVPMSKVIVNIEKFGNTSSATIPLALDEAIRSKKVRRGDIILLTSFGAGLTWGSILARY
ncbi:MAG: 3-oxoacyl-[acyl-carrier-protein] synthase III C-terminal domain-containing protein, partial [Candidatus Cloacimonetes bacterium]|nr:3-oxoacyl-[acyl-carrier-protein] synthase III C-terminal domain-containing protein [Candidatus Cloacimonadota bacterium]